MTAASRGGDSPAAQSEGARVRIESAGERLVRAMLFVKEAPLAQPVAGTSAFAAEFSQQGKRDPKGRSLRDLDLTQRLFRYPLSFLIYSESFDAMPPVGEGLCLQAAPRSTDGRGQAAGVHPPLASRPRRDPADPRGDQAGVHLGRMLSNISGSVLRNSRTSGMLLYANQTMKAAMPSESMPSSAATDAWCRPPSA